MKNVITICSLLILTLSGMFGQDNGIGKIDKNSPRTFLIEELPDGYRTEIKTFIGDILARKQVFVTDKKFYTTRWEFMDTETRTDITAVLDKAANTVFITGTLQGKAVDENNDLKDEKWIQNFTIGMTDFVQSSDKTSTFAALAPGGPFALKPGTFKAKKQGTEYIQLRDGKVETVKIKISISVFYSCTCWYRISDGFCVKFVDKDNEILMGNT